MLIPNRPSNTIAMLIFPIRLFYIVIQSCNPTISLRLPHSSRQLEAKTSHTALVLINCARAVLRGIVRVTKEQALVAQGLLFFADAAGLRSTTPFSQYLIEVVEGEAFTLMVGAVSGADCLGEGSRFTPVADAGIS